MIATRFRSVYWVGGVAVAALSCYLVSQRVAAERANLSRVEMEIALGERQIRSLETEIGTRAGMNQIERWNVEVLALSAPKAAQFMGSEVQLASLVRPSAPAMEAPAPVQLAAADAPAAASAPQVSRVSYQTSMPTIEDEDEDVDSPRVVRASYAAAAPVSRAEPAPAPKIARKAEADRPAKQERTAKAEPASKPKPAAKPERSAKRDVKATPERSAKRDAPRKAEPERSAKRDTKAPTEKNVKRVASRKTEDNTPRVRPAIYVKPVSRHQSVALLDDKLMGDLGRLAASERTGGKRNR